METVHVHVYICNIGGLPLLICIMACFVDAFLVPTAASLAARSGAAATSMEPLARRRLGVSKPGIFKPCYRRHSINLHVHVLVP